MNWHDFILGFTAGLAGGLVGVYVGRNVAMWRDFRSVTAGIVGGYRRARAATHIVEDANAALDAHFASAMEAAQLTPGELEASRARHPSVTGTVEGHPRCGEIVAVGAGTFATCVRGRGHLGPHATTPTALEAIGYVFPPF